MRLQDYMTTRQAAEALGMKPIAVTRAVQRGTFAGVKKMDYFYLIPKASVKAEKKRRAKTRRSGDETIA